MSADAQRQWTVGVVILGGYKVASDMHSEAMERLRQMYSGASSTASVTSKPIVSPQKNNEPKQQLEPDKKVVSKGVFDMFLQDKEKSLILILLVILLSEKADESLILALVYLIL